MLTVKIPIRPYNNDKIYSKPEHTFNEGLTILVGPNGAGKSTILLYLREKCKEEKIPVFIYDNYLDGGDRAISDYNFIGDTTAFATAMCSSEGQQINMNFGYKMKSLGQFVKKNKGAKELVILFDALDSGLDVANIADIKKFLEKTVIEDIHKSDTRVYILVTANSYAFAKNSRCYDVAKNKEITFNSYEEYENFILERVSEKKLKG